MSKDDEWFSKGSVIVLLLCGIGALSAISYNGSGEAWWGWLFLIGLGVWFFVVPLYLHQPPKNPPDSGDEETV
jgi:hypothetical protein